MKKLLSATKNNAPATAPPPTTDNSTDFSVENAVNSETKVDEDQNEWLTTNHSNNVPNCHETKIVKVTPSQLVWAKLSGYKSEKNLFYPGRICAIHGWRDVPDDCELIEFFNLPHTYEQETIMQNIERKNIVSFNCPLSKKVKLYNLEQVPDMWKEYDLSWDSERIAELNSFLKRKKFKFCQTILKTMEEYAHEASIEHEKDLNSNNEHVDLSPADIRHTESNDHDNNSLSQEKKIKSDHSKGRKPKQIPLKSKPFNVDDFYLKTGDYISYQNRVC